MRLTVCELPNESETLESAWNALAAHVRAQASDLVLLPEMPFSPWIFLDKPFDAQRWNTYVKDHERWLPRLADLAPAVVLGSLPIERDGKRLNQAFVWTAESGPQLSHEKYYLPEDEGFWESSWYQRGSGDFSPVQAGPAKVGFQICSELWFMDRARRYGQQGVHLIACPRATGKPTVEKWLVGGRAAAVISGAYHLSSNRRSAPDSPADLGGQGWIVDPDGAVLAVTTPEQPFVTCEVDLPRAEHAKTTYPRYMPD